MKSFYPRQGNNEIRCKRLMEVKEIEKILVGRKDNKRTGRHKIVIHCTFKFLKNIEGKNMKPNEILTGMKYKKRNY